jgi:hypothetical protein
MLLSKWEGIRADFASSGTCSRCCLPLAFLAILHSASSRHVVNWVKRVQRDGDSRNSDGEREADGTGRS